MKTPFIVLIMAMLTTAASSNMNFFQKSYRDKRLLNDAVNAREEFIKTDALMKNLFNAAYSYAIFPNIGKGGWGIGGATGNGVVFLRGVPIGSAKMTQVTIGFQAGGQSYREVLFFESDASLNDFKNNQLEFSAQASAVIAAEGASANVKYKNGVMIFTQPKGGLMYEASVGGQKFRFSSYK